MRYAQLEHTLRDGNVCCFRSPEEADADNMIDYLRQTSGETHFMLRNPEEVTLTPEAEARFLRSYLDDERRLLLAAFIGDKPVASAGLVPVGPYEKIRHRSEVGISVLRPYWRRGIGRKMMHILIDEARNLGFTQMELGVFSDNERAQALYRSLGFSDWGTIPDAYHLNDGTYRDEILMGRRL